MFGSKREKSSASPATGIRHAHLATLISHDVTLIGDMEFSEGLRMDGSVKGNVSGKSGSQTLLVLSEHGTIEGNVHGYDIVVNGRIVGDVIADHFVDLQSNAHVTGNIHYQQLQMDCGASVDGKLSRHDGSKTLGRPDGEQNTVGLLSGPEVKSDVAPRNNGKLPNNEKASNDEKSPNAGKPPGSEKPSNDGRSPGSGEKPSPARKS